MREILSPQALSLVLMAVALMTLGGCLAYQVVSAPVKVAGAAVVAVGETAGAVVTTTGKVAVSAVKAAGAMGSGGLDAAARLGQAGLVTFADTATDTVVRVPWSQGLTLASASQTARVSMAQRAVEVVRAGKIVYAATRPAGGAGERHGWRSLPARPSRPSVAANGSALK